MLWCESWGYCRPTPRYKMNPEMLRSVVCDFPAHGGLIALEAQHILIAHDMVERLAQFITLDLLPEPELDPRLPANPLQRAGDLVQPALDVPPAEFRLDIRDDVERGGRPVRRRTVVRGETVEKLDEMRIVSEEPAHDLVHRLERRDLRQVAQMGQVFPVHLPPPFLQRMMQERIRAQIVQPARVRQEARHVGPLPEGGVLVDNRAVRPAVTAGHGQGQERQVVRQ